MQVDDFMPVFAGILLLGTLSETMVAFMGRTLVEKGNTGAMKREQAWATVPIGAVTVLLAILMLPAATTWTILIGLTSGTRAMGVAERVLLHGRAFGFFLRCMPLTYGFAIAISLTIVGVFWGTTRLMRRLAL